MSTCMHLLHFVTCVVLSEPCRFELLSYTSFKVQVQDGQLLGICGELARLILQKKALEG